MDDITGANPHLWLPRGTTWTQSQFTANDSSPTGTKQMFTDIRNKYMPTGDFRAQ